MEGMGVEGGGGGEQLGQQTGEISVNAIILLQSLD